MIGKPDQIVQSRGQSNDLLATDGSALSRIHGSIVWEQFLAATGPYEVLLTLGFIRYLDLTRAVSSANHFLLRLNRKCFGKNFARRRRYLSGIAVLERKRASLTAPRSPHFHFLLRGSESDRKLDVASLADAAKFHSARLRYPTLNNLHPMGGRISAPGCVDVRPVTDLARLAGYLTKELHVNALDADNIGFVGVHGIDGLST